MVYHLDFAWVELPLCFAVQGWHVDSPRDEAVTAAQRNGLQGPLDSIEDGGQQTRAQLH